MTEVLAARLLNFNEFPGWDVIDVSVGPGFEPLLLIWKRPEESLTEPDEKFRPGIASRHQRGDGPNHFRIVHFRAGNEITLDLPTTSQNYSRAQPLSGGSYLLVHDWAREGKPNADVFSSAGLKLDSWFAGSGTEHVQSTDSGLVWIGYDDEGIFRDRIGGEGVNCFSVDGRFIFGYNSFAKAQEVDCISHCYAMNVVSESEIWLWYYTEFPLVQLVDGQIAGHWPDMWSKAPIKGSHGFAVVGDRILFGGGYHDTDRLFLVSLDGPRSQRLVPVNQDGSPFETFRAFGRGSKLYLQTKSALFMIEAADLPAW